MHVGERFDLHGHQRLKHWQWEEGEPQQLHQEVLHQYNKEVHYV